MRLISIIGIVAGMVIGLIAMSIAYAAGDWWYMALSLAGCSLGVLVLGRLLVREDNPAH